jgi:hypothetical protein
MSKYQGKRRWQKDRWYAIYLTIAFYGGILAFAFFFLARCGVIPFP